jgi:hypothetical protein
MVKRLVVLGDEVAITEELNSADIGKRKAVPRWNPQPIDPLLLVLQ